MTCFFFPPIFGSIFVFFFLEKFTSHSLTHLKMLFFFPAPEKKTAFLLTHSILAKNSQKTNFSREIKKNGTFGYIWKKVVSGRAYMKDRETRK